ncbi:GntR family transcriptional regulator [Microbacterium sp.]|uniref:FadR/GntR family transcriptional regulator n=1 Tax=Microbacterium sp. TaxID=51671 RepID=UPI0025DAFBBF|nr:GntR family transcriptional regulator [Microbacterium sp.]
MTSSTTGAVDSPLVDAVLRPVRGHMAFESCVEQLGSAIQLGIFRPGDRLPSERELAERLNVSGSRELDPSFSVLVVLEGAGTLESAAGSLPLRRGSTVLTAYGDGPVGLSGELQLIRCRPPR